MKWTEIQTGKTHSAFQHFMVALGDQAEVAVDRINAEPVFAERLAAYAQNGGIEATVSQKLNLASCECRFFLVSSSTSTFRNFSGKTP